MVSLVKQESLSEKMRELGFHDFLQMRARRTKK